MDYFNNSKFLSPLLVPAEQGCGRPPKPVYGYVSFESTNYRAVATYYCDDGYAFSKKGAQHRVCLENGHWSGETPVCQPQYYWFQNMAGLNYYLVAN